MADLVGDDRIEPSSLKVVEVRLRDHEPTLVAESSSVEKTLKENSYYLRLTYVFRDFGEEEF